MQSDKSNSGITCRSLKHVKSVECKWRVCKGCLHTEPPWDIPTCKVSGESRFYRQLMLILNIQRRYVYVYLSIRVNQSILCGLVCIWQITHTQRWTKCCLLHVDWCLFESDQLSCRSVHPLFFIYLYSCLPQSKMISLPPADQGMSPVWALDKVFFAVHI